MRVTLKEGQTTVATVHPVDEDGKPAELAGPVEWSLDISEDGSGLHVEFAEDTLSATFRGIKAGTIATITIKDGDLAEEHEIIVTAPVPVTKPVVSLGVTFSDPEPA